MAQWWRHKPIKKTRTQGFQQIRISTISTPQLSRSKTNSWHHRWRENICCGLKTSMRKMSLSERKPSADVKKEPWKRFDGSRHIWRIGHSKSSEGFLSELAHHSGNPEDSSLYWWNTHPLIYHIGGMFHNADLVTPWLLTRMGTLEEACGVAMSKPEDFWENRLSWSMTSWHRRFSAKRRRIWSRQRDARNDMLIPYFTPNACWANSSSSRSIDRGETNSAFVLPGINCWPQHQQCLNSTKGDINTLYSTHRFYVLWEKKSEKSSFRFTPSLAMMSLAWTFGRTKRIDQRQPTAEIRFEHIWHLQTRQRWSLGVDLLAAFTNFKSPYPLAENAATLILCRARSITTYGLGLMSRSLCFHWAIPSMISMLGE